jgi:hypothetical protein
MRTLVFTIFRAPPSSRERGPLSARYFDHPDMSGVVDDPQIQQRIEQQISAGSFPASNANLIYLVFLASGVAITPGRLGPCQVFGGNHDAISNEIC